MIDAFNVLVDPGIKALLPETVADKIVGLEVFVSLSFKKPAGSSLVLATSKSSVLNPASLATSSSTDILPVISCPDMRLPVSGLPLPDWVASMAISAFGAKTEPTKF